MKYLLKKIVRSCGTRGKLSGVTTPAPASRKRFPLRGKMLRPAIEICGVRLSIGHCHSLGQETPHASSQLRPSGQEPRPGGRGGLLGVLMWTTLFGIAFVISFLSLFAAIVMDF